MNYSLGILFLAFVLIVQDSCIVNADRGSRGRPRSQRLATIVESKEDTPEITLAQCESARYTGKPCHDCCRQFERTGLPDPKTKRCSCHEPAESIEKFNNLSVYRRETEEEKAACDMLDRSSMDCMKCCMYRARYVREAEASELASGPRSCRCAEPFESADEW